MAPRVWTGVAAPVAVVSGLLLVIAVGAAWYIRNLQQSVATMLADHVTSMRAAQELELSVRDLKNQGVRYVISGDPKQLEPIPRLQKQTMNALARAEAFAQTEAEQTIMARTRAGLQTFFEEYEKMTEGNPHRADYFKTVDLIDRHMTHDVIEPTREYLRLNEGMLVRANEENRALASRLTTGLVDHL